MRARKFFREVNSMCQNSCPIYNPAKLSVGLVKELCISANIFKPELENQVELLRVFNLYFQKFFAGNVSLLEDFSDLPIENLYLWSEAKISKDVHVKQVINDIKKFDKVLRLIK